MFNFLTNNLQLPLNYGNPSEPLIEIYRYCPKTETTEASENIQLVFATQDAAFNQLIVRTGDHNSYFVMPETDSYSTFRCQLQGYFDFTPNWYIQQEE